ncbi:MAG TPA: sigma-70 family RNA polymerase sigma factor [Marmoricola sp.]|jgi:RNA polymerase sigma factor (sigma-70 family)
MTVSEVPETTAGTGSGAPWGAAAAAFTRWRDGDSTGLEDLVRLLSPVLWQVVRATGLDRDRAEDVVQTTWIALVDHADSITSPQAIAAWLCTSARREAWRAGRQATRERPTDDQVLTSDLPHEESPEGRVILDDEAELLRQCLGRLPERCQKLLRIVAAGPRPNYTDVASTLGMPVGSIGPTRGRCLDKLRHELIEAGGTR